MRLYKAKYTPDARNNFPLAHSRPQLNDNVIIQYRQSDTMRQGGGYALEAQGLFLGWIRAGDIDTIRNLGGEGGEGGEDLPQRRITGRITGIARVFQWAQGGGTCVEGTVDTIKA